MNGFRQRRLLALWFYCFCWAATYHPAQAFRRTEVVGARSNTYFSDTALESSGLKVFARDAATTNNNHRGSGGDSTTEAAAARPSSRTTTRRTAPSTVVVGKGCATRSEHTASQLLTSLFELHFGRQQEPPPPLSPSLESSALSARGGARGGRLPSAAAKANKNPRSGNGSNSTSDKPLLPITKLLLKLDAGIGLFYALGFLLFPGEIVEIFFNTGGFLSTRPLWNLAVRMIGINHLGYVAGLLSMAPERAVKVATGFLTLGGLTVVYYAQFFLNTAEAFWSCTILTTLLLLAHWHVVLKQLRSSSSSSSSD